MATRPTFSSASLGPLQYFWRQTQLALHLSIVQIAAQFVEGGRAADDQGATPRRSGHAWLSRTSKRTHIQNSGTLAVSIHSTVIGDIPIGPNTTF